MNNIGPQYKTMPEHYLLCFNDDLIEMGKFMRTWDNL
jgi:hypothetical protein